MTSNGGKPKTAGPAAAEIDRRGISQPNWGS
jgi:hypothetical protein